MTLGKDFSLSRDAVADPEINAANAHAAAAPGETPAPVSRPPIPQAAGSSRFHESAHAHVAGAAIYVDDIQKSGERCTPRPSFPPSPTAGCSVSIRQPP